MTAACGLCIPPMQDGCQARSMVRMPEAAQPLPARSYEARGRRREGGKGLTFPGVVGIVAMHLPREFEGSQRGMIGAFCASETTGQHPNEESDGAGEIPSVPCRRRNLRDGSPWASRGPIVRRSGVLTLLSLPSMRSAGASRPEGSCHPHESALRGVSCRTRTVRARTFGAGEGGSTRAPGG
jgi:hypothetical protein